MYLGIDLGTSGLKCIVMDDAGDVVAEGKSPLSVQRPHPTHAEQNPSDWFDALEAAVLSIPASVRSGVAAIGLAGQMHGAVCLDGSGEVLRPAILWNDGRAWKECADIEAHEERSRAITGNLALPGFTAPKLLWIKRHEPEVFRQVRSVLLPKDYLRLRLSGDRATDLSDASGTLWLDVAGRRWSEPMLAATDLDVSCMPDLFEGHEVTGTLTASLAARWGMPPVPIVAGGGDNAAGAIGVGVHDDGDALLSLGTSGVIFAPSREHRPNAESGVHAFCHAVPGRWHQMTVMLSAMACVDWAARLCGTNDIGSFVESARKANETSVPIFLPYLSGERTPHNDPHARGALFNMDHDTGSPEVARAVLEGIAFGLADGLSSLSGADGFSEVTVIGGGARSEFFGDILATTLDKTLTYRRRSDVGPALGAARLARAGTSASSVFEGMSKPDVIAVRPPSSQLAEGLQLRRQTFRQLYPANQPLFPHRDAQS